MSEGLKKQIKSIPTEGEWWTAYSEGTFLKLGEQLLEKGFTEGQVMEFLLEAYMAVANEYGN